MTTRTTAAMFNWERGDQRVQETMLSNQCWKRVENALRYLQATLGASHTLELWNGEQGGQTIHVTERARSVLGTGQDEPVSRDEALMKPLAERELFCYSLVLKLLWWPFDARTGSNPFCVQLLAEVDFGRLRVVSTVTPHLRVHTRRVHQTRLLSKHTLNASHSVCCCPVMVLLECLDSAAAVLPEVQSEEGKWEPSQLGFLCSSLGKT